MKENELRIGNLLRDKVSKTELKVIELTEENIITYVIDRSKFPLQKGWGLEPIPLTEEWLLKFGFEKNKSNKNRFIHYISGFEIERQGSKFAYAVWGGEDAPFLTQFFGHHNYVHQLQNLYFALTGEELTIKQ